MTQYNENRELLTDTTTNDRALSPIVTIMETPALAQLSDELIRLVNAVMDKDREAFDTLYDLTVKRVYSLALRITQQADLAEEVVSDVYFQVWQQADMYVAERGSVQGWLCILCRSRALDAVRRDNSLMRRSTTTLDSAPAEVTEYQPHDLLLAAEQGSALHAALARLSGKERQVLALAFFKGFTHSEIANYLDVPLGTVKTQIQRTVKKLKELITLEATLSGDPNE